MSLVPFNLSIVTVKQLFIASQIKNITVSCPLVFSCLILSKSRLYDASNLTTIQWRSF